MISVDHVSKIFGNTTAVDDISFGVNEGEKFILLGTSGCGKTTTLKMINRLISTSSGEITVGGKNIDHLPPEQLRRNIGYVLQRNSLFPHYTIFENIAVVPGLLGMTKEKTAERIETLMEKLHLPKRYLPLYPQALSGGEAQRVNLARALVADPAMLLMDEPFGALDAITRSAIRKQFAELPELKRKTIIMVTHDIQEAFDIGDRVCLMDKGKVMQTGTPAELLFNPSSDFVKNFLSDAFIQLSLSVTRLQEIWPLISSEANADETSWLKISAQASIKKAIEQINNKNDHHLLLNIHNEETKESKLVSWKGLVKAFSQYKN